MDALLGDGIGEESLPAIDDETDFDPLRMQVEMPDQPLNSRPDIGRVPRQKPHYSKRSEPVPLTHQQSEMLAACDSRAMLQKPAACEERYPVIAIVEELRFKAQF